VENDVYFFPFTILLFVFVFPYISKIHSRNCGSSLVSSSIENSTIRCFSLSQDMFRWVHRMQ
jgi:hypothetical protein